MTVTNLSPFDGLSKTITILQEELAPYLEIRTIFDEVVKKYPLEENKNFPSDVNVSHYIESSFLDGLKTLPIPSLSSLHEELKDKLPKLFRYIFILAQVYQETFRFAQEQDRTNLICDLALNDQHHHAQIIGHRTFNNILSPKMQDHNEQMQHDELIRKIDEFIMNGEVEKVEKISVIIPIRPLEDHSLSKMISFLVLNNRSEHAERLTDSMSTIDRKYLALLTIVKLLSQQGKIERAKQVTATIAHSAFKDLALEAIIETLLLDGDIECIKELHRMIFYTEDTDRFLKRAVVRLLANNHIERAELIAELITTTTYKERALEKIENAKKIKRPRLD